MRLKVLGSGSKGNCYLLYNDDEVLIIEAGLPLKEVKKALGFDLSRVVGLLITHEHGDHAKYINEYINAGIKTFATTGTLEACKIDSHYASKIEYLSYNYVGNFIFTAFPTNHDASMPCGFLIKHDEIGNLLFATDTYYVKYQFKNQHRLNNILIECNYSEDLLSDNLNSKLRNRLYKSHMSLLNCKNMLDSNDLNEVAKIVLIHLSDKHSDADRFKQEIHDLTALETYIAERGLDIEMNKTNF